VSDNPSLTSAELEAARRLQKKIIKHAETQQDELVRQQRFSKSKYKIQIWIKSDRSIHKPLTFSLSLWESGKRLNGGGDESMWICRKKPSAPKPKAPFGVATRTFKKEAQPDGCGSPIPGDHAVYGRILCPHCGLSWDTEFIADALFYRVPVEKAAEIITTWYRLLDSSCDIYVKFRPEDVRVKMMAREYGVHHARQHKGMVIYPNANLIKDCINGATVESRIKALLLA
jgi:hypothetical protein